MLLYTQKFEQPMPSFGAYTLNMAKNAEFRLLTAMDEKVYSEKAAPEPLKQVNESNISLNAKAKCLKCSK